MLLIRQLGIKSYKEAIKLDSLCGLPRFNLTPGDYTVVRKKAEILGLLDQPTELSRMLAVECSIKDSPVKQIGFIAG